MKRVPINQHFEAEYTTTEKVIFGRLYHVEKGGGGWGSLSTPIAYYFVTQPEFTEGYHRYWRVDCFFRAKHKLCPEPMSTGEDLVAALKKENLCSDPMWLSVHLSDEIQGKAYGDLYDD